MHAPLPGSIHNATDLNEYFTSVVAALTEGVLIQRHDGTVVTANAAAAEALGFDIDQLVGEKLDTIEGLVVDIQGNPVPREDLPGRRCVRSGKPSVGRIFGWVHGERPTKWFEVDAHPIFLPDTDAPNAVMTSLRDITTRLAAERHHDHAARRLELVLANSTVGYRILDANGDLVESNPPVLTDSGFVADGSKQFPHLDAVAYRELAEVFLRVREQPRASESIDIKVMSLTEGERWFECVTTNYLDEPTVGGIVVNYRDVTDRKHAEDSVRFQARLLDTAGQAIIATDDDGHIAFWNQAAEEMYGRTSQDAVGQLITDVIELWDGDEAVAEMALRVPEGEPWAGDLWIQRPDGSRLPVFASVTPTFDPDGTFRAVVGVATDISERKRAEQDLAHQAARDPLTGLPNREMLVDHLDRMLDEARGAGQEFGVLFIDIDRFKVINDGIGHAIGDQVLCIAADRLVAALPGQIVARFGGDEFVVLHTATDSEPLPVVADAVLRAFGQPFPVDGHDLFLSASVGVASATPDAPYATSDTLLRDADVAMYRAKENGRAQVCVFDDRLRRRATKRLSREMALRRALERDELRLEYQPVMSLREDSLVGFEALIRWQHPDEGLVGPDKFIPIAEETGLILPIGAWVFDQATKQLASWQRDLGLHQLSMSVNLSPKQILSSALAREVESAIGASGIDPPNLMLEITETSLMHDVERSIRVMHSLKALGVRLAVDDFGTGYSSLMYLKRLPVDVLKIDRSFISGLGSDPDDSAIVRAISSLGTALDLSVIAEGVETNAQLDALGALDCSFGQGWFWSKAMPPADLPGWLATRADDS